MAYKMRRTDRQMDDEATLTLLKNAEYGTLSIVDALGQPYGVPLSYAMLDDCTLVFHGAKVGRKSECLVHESRACFTVIGDTEVLPSQFSTNYESVIAEGIVVLLEGQEKINALKALIIKYSVGFEDAGEQYIMSDHGKTHTYALKIVSLTGKKRT